MTGTKRNVQISEKNGIVPYKARSENLLTLLDEYEISNLSYTDLTYA